MAFTRLSISLLLSGLILSAGMPAQAAPETVMVPEVTAMALEGKWPADWSYQGENGPAHWGELHPSYSKCARGRVQSPVDLGKATTRSRRSTVRVAFHPIRYEIFNDGRGIRAVPLEAQHPIRIDRHDYTLKHIVFRAPSEHTFQGRHYPLEAQLVYEADDGAVATILPSGSYIALDVNVDDDLEAEGYARDVVRAVQEARRAAGLHVSDRIALTLGVPEPRIGAAAAHIDFIAGETLAVRTDVRAASDLTIDVEKA